MSNLPHAPYVMQSQSREALYEAQQIRATADLPDIRCKDVGVYKVEPIPPFSFREPEPTERTDWYLGDFKNAMIDHYNTHVVARLNTPHT